MKSQLELIIQFVGEIEPESAISSKIEEDVLQTSETLDAPLSLAEVGKGREPKLSQEARARLIPPMRLQQGVEIRDLGCRLETVSNAILEEPKCGRFPKTSRIVSDGLEGPVLIHGVDVRQAVAKIDNEKFNTGKDPTKVEKGGRESGESVCSLSLADPVQPIPSPRLKRKSKAPQPPLSPANGRSAEMSRKEGSTILGFDNLISDLCVHSSNIESEVAYTQKKEEDRRSQVGTITLRFIKDIISLF